ncbi:MAG: hypothetical protein K2I23_05465 [Clostridia bacterium]|nr:hypothetical protein [Clostridia bacterium]
MKILFICMSNICRSPYCEYVFRKIVQEDDVLSKNIEWVKSSAVFYKSLKINHKSVKVLTDEGFDREYVLSHQPTFKWGKGRRYFKDADIIIGMTRSNKWFLPFRFHKKFALLSVLASGKYKAIPDPVLIKEQEKYNKAMEEIKGYLISYADELKQKFSA